jgi:hypothetical protein
VKVAGRSPATFFLPDRQSSGAKLDSIEAMFSGPGSFDFTIA